MKFTVKLRGKPHEFESTLSDNDAATAVGLLLTTGRVADGVDRFLKDLYSQYKQGRPLSDAQLAWLHYYASGRQPGKQANAADNAKIAALDGSRLIDMFRRAQGQGGEIKLQCPQMFVKIHGHEVKLKLCGPGTKNPGGLYLTAGDDYLGKITAEGRLMPVRQLFDGLADSLVEFCQDPQGFAVRFGRVTGRCCFCGLELSNRHSIYNGYGEICADHWGLPYGKAPDDWQPTVEAHGRATCQDLKDGA